MRTKISSVKTGSCYIGCELSKYVYSFWGRHILRGCVDWNDEVAGIKFKDNVTFFMDVWIEIFHCCSTDRASRCHILRGCVDWNKEIANKFRRITVWLRWVKSGRKNGSVLLENFISLVTNTRTWRLCLVRVFFCPIMVRAVVWRENMPACIPMWSYNRIGIKLLRKKIRSTQTYEQWV